ncbi:hypothetical protein HPB50_006595 [Hyalomma asiaticum]|uniref:Uncharacterized protein n=1 Tax=Hyalomma asiaticum TaxID=266040 RepID=A0ACB7SLR9_HYAAI|nr:hypothetical protein HPB50_006595 [Hyalomma asiaticum]
MPRIRRLRAPDTLWQGERDPSREEGQRPDRLATTRLGAGAQARRLRPVAYASANFALNWHTRCMAVLLSLPYCCCSCCWYTDAVE